MAFSKQHLYPQEDQITSSFAKALAHPARLQILKQLHLEGPTCVEDIVKNHPICLESISGHLKALRETQLVNWKEHFPFIFYSLNENTTAKAFKHLESFFMHSLSKK